MTLSKEVIEKIKDKFRYKDLLDSIVDLAAVLPIRKDDPRLRRISYFEALNESYNSYQSSPGDPTKLTHYAATLFNSGLEEESLKVYATDLRECRDSGPSHHVIGRILMDNELYEQAILLFDKGLTLDYGEWLHCEFHFDISDLKGRLRRSDDLKRKLNDFDHYLAGKILHDTTTCERRTAF